MAAVFGDAPTGCRCKGAQPFRCDPVLYCLDDLGRAVEDDEGVTTAHCSGVAVDGGEVEDSDFGFLSLFVVSCGGEEVRDERTLFQHRTTSGIAEERPRGVFEDDPGDVLRSTEDEAFTKEDLAEGVERLHYCRVIEGNLVVVPLGVD